MINEMNVLFEKPKQKNILNAIKFTKNIYDLYGNSNSYKEFINYGDADSKNASHRIRLIHDEFLLDAYKTRCVGSFYRSENVINSKKDLLNKNKECRVHCEHVIPINLLTKYIYYLLKPNSYEQILRFLIQTQLVCCVEKNSDEKINLSIKRKIGNKELKWASEHPNFIFDNKTIRLINPFLNSPINLLDVKPFLRYLGTGIKIYSILNKNYIDAKTYSVQDHIVSTKKYYNQLFSSVGMENIVK